MVLAEVEEAYIVGRRVEPGRALQQILKAKSVTGFLVTVPFITLELVIARLKQTKLHLVQDPGAEFALAVKLHAYPGNILALWVFAACICPS